MTVYSYDGRPLEIGMLVYLSKVANYSRDNLPHWDSHFGGVPVRVMAIDTERSPARVTVAFQEPREVWHSGGRHTSATLAETYCVPCSAVGDDWQAHYHTTHVDLDGFLTPMNPTWLSVEKDGRCVDLQDMRRRNTASIRAHAERTYACGS